MYHWVQICLPYAKQIFFYKYKSYQNQEPNQTNGASLQCRKIFSMNIILTIFELNKQQDQVILHTPLNAIHIVAKI
jgi:hypothetical protein